MSLISYPSPSELVDALEAQSKLSYDRGLVRAVHIANLPPTTRGFITLLVDQNFREKGAAPVKYSYTLAEFQALDFLTDLRGISLYFAAYPTANIADWDALPSQTRANYISQADQIGDQLRVLWPEDFRFQSPSDSTPPVFDGIVSLVQASSTRLDASWEEASDNLALPEQIVYRIYVKEVLVPAKQAEQAVAFQAATLPAKPARQFVTFTLPKLGADPTGLPNDTTPFNLTVTVWGQPPQLLTILGQDAQTFNDLVTAITAAFGAYPAAVSFNEYASRLEFVTTGVGQNEFIALTDGGLLAALTDFGAIQPAIGGTNAVAYPLPKSISDPTDLPDDPTPFTFSIETDNQAAQIITVLGEEAQTIKDLVDAINAQFVLLSFAAECLWDEVNDRLVFRTSLTGPTRTITILDIDLFAALLGYDSVLAAVPGADKLVPVEDYSQYQIETTPGVLSASIDWLKPGVEYYVGVRAVDRYGNEDANTVRLFASTASAPDLVPPVFGGAGSAVAADNSRITLSWTAAEDAVTPQASIVYDIWQALVSGGQNLAGPPDYVTAPGATSYVVTGLPAGVAHYFVIRARDASGNRDANTVEVGATTIV